MNNLKGIKEALETTWGAAASATPAAPASAADAPQPMLLLLLATLQSHVAFCGGFV